MTTLSIHSYDTARAAERKIQLLEPRPGHRVNTDDAAVISWPEDADRPLAWQATPVNARDPLSGAFWGMLFAHLLLIPLGYAQPPTIAPGVADSSLNPFGLSGPHLSAIRRLLGPGTSAILALQADEDVDTLATALGCDQHARLDIVLDAVQSRRLRAAFAEGTGRG